ncbi:hypothetical protein ACIBHX_41195 [Nonomuraea sp. NPDC050536]|uniref:hypothetical protein n=1 Tax=Nonomuraea sp. NPDC050536 TaxID=3364366 RepID=UPI0037C86696
MLTSKARRRLAQKTSALGIVSTLLLFTGAALAVSSPAQALVDPVSTCTTTSMDSVTVPIGTGTGGDKGPKHIVYTCTGTAITGSPTVDLSVSVDSVQSGSSFDVSLAIPQLTLATAVTAASTMQVDGKLTVTNGTVTDAGAKQGGAITTSQPTSVPATTVKYKVSPTTGSTGSVTIKPGDLKLTVQAGSGGGGTGIDVVTYKCTAGSTDTIGQTVKIKTTLTPPTSAQTNQQFSIGWSGTYETGYELKAPSTGTLTPKIFAYATMTGISGLTSATGEGTLGTITPNATIPLPSSGTVSLRAMPSTVGTVTVKPGKLNFGSNASTGNQPMIECIVQNDSELKTYTFSVTAGSSSSSTPTNSSTSSSTPTTTHTPKPTKTTTRFVTATPTKKSSKTPKAGAETGGGGEIGPDGRVFMLVGSLLILGAGAGGLVLRRRGLGKG